MASGRFVVLLIFAFFDKRKNTINIEIVIASHIPPRPYSTEACHSGAAFVGEQVMHSLAFNGSCDEDCNSSAEWFRCLPGLRRGWAHQTSVG